MIRGEVKKMDEQNFSEYQPRPHWQVWLARAGVGIVVVGYILYLLQIAHSG